MKKLRPPKGAINPSYGGSRVTSQGIDVFERDVESLLGEGWTVAEDGTPSFEGEDKGEEPQENGEVR